MGDIALKLRSKDESLEAHLEKIQSAIWNADDIDVGEDEMDLSVVWTFPDAVIVKNWEDQQLYEIEFEEVDGEIEFEDAQPVEEMYVQKSLLNVNPDVSMKKLFDVLYSHDDLETCYKDLTKLDDVDNPEALYSWIHYRAKGEFPTISFEAAYKSKHELTGPVVEKNNEKQIAKAAVLVPGEEDSDGESVTKSKIEEAAHEWMENYRNVDLQHTLNNVGVPVESYILPQDITVKMEGEEKVLPEGSWILASKFNDETWKAIKNEELTGYSVMGIKRQALKKAQKSNSDVALKKTLLQDLGEDWVAAAVSVVDNPAVPKSKFFALKSKNTNEHKANDKGLMDKLKSALSFKSKDENEKQTNIKINKNNFAIKEGREFSKENRESLEAALATLSNMLSDFDVEVIEKDDGEVVDRLTASELIEKYNSDESQEEGGEDEMDKEQLKQVLTTFKSELEKKMINPLQNDIKSLKEKLKEEGEEDEAKKSSEDEEQNTDDEGTEEENEDEEKNEDVEALKSEVEDLRKFKTKVEKMFGETKANKAKGQDDEDENKNTAKKSRYKGRDDFGRKRRSDK